MAARWRAARCGRPSHSDASAAVSGEQSYARRMPRSALRARGPQTKPSWPSASRAIINESSGSCSFDSATEHASLTSPASRNAAQARAGSCFANKA